MTEVSPDRQRLVDVARGYFDALGAHGELNVILLSDDAGPSGPGIAGSASSGVAGNGGVCVVDPVRGGGKIYVAPDGSALFVGSALDFDAGLAAFRAGRRSLTARLNRPPTTV